jgi:hypothetical protein
MLFTLSMLLLAAPSVNPTFPQVERTEVFVEALAGTNGVGSVGGAGLGARLTLASASVGTRCSLTSGSLAHFTPVAGFLESGDRLACFVDVGPQLLVGPVRVRAMLSVGGGADRTGGAIRGPLLVTGAGAEADLPIRPDLSIAGHARMENALGPKGMSGALIIGVGFAFTL